MDEKFVIYNFKEDNFLNITEMLFCVNLIFSYPLTIFPTNKIIESFIFESPADKTPFIKWARNFSRLIVCFLGCFFSILFKDYLDDFLGVTGAVLGISVILIIPTICHYKICAETKVQKTLDIIVVCVSFSILVLCTYNGTAAWIKERSSDQ